jgi:hypothetical protein
MHRSFRRFSVATAGTAALVAAWLGSASATPTAQPQGVQNHGSQHAGTQGSSNAPEQRSSEAAPTSRHHGAAIQHLPAHCQTIAYADINGIAATDPVQQNRDLIRDRARLLLEQNPSLSATVHKALDALGANGIDWKKDVDEVAVCMTGDQLESMTIAGNFEGKDLVGALVGGTPDAGRTAITPMQRNGRTYAVIDRYYAAQVTPSVLAIAPDIDRVDALRRTGPGLAQRGGQADDLALFTSTRPSGHVVVSTVQPHPNDFVIETTIRNPSGKFDVAHEKSYLEDRIGTIANELRSTPLAATADAVQHTDVKVQGNEARMRTELPKKDVRQAIAAAVVSHRDDWLAILPRQAPAMGGGPGPNQGPSMQNPPAQPEEHQQPEHETAPRQQSPEHEER